jgi:hypothetical protein
MERGRDSSSLFCILISSCSNTIYFNILPLPLKKLAASWALVAHIYNPEAEIRRITVQGQPGQTVYKTPISKITRAKKIH